MYGGGYGNQQNASGGECYNNQMNVNSGYSNGGYGNRNGANFGENGSQRMNENAGYAANKPELNRNGGGTNFAGEDLNRTHNYQNTFNQVITNYFNLQFKKSFTILCQGPEQNIIMNNQNYSDGGGRNGGRFENVFFNKLS